LDRARFEADGYLVVEDLLDPRENLDPVAAEYEVLLVARRPATSMDNEPPEQRASSPC
jgi:hypothetical protein